MDNPEVPKNDDETSAKSDMAKDQWGNVIRVQIHFNELIHRSRQLTATLTFAAYGYSATFFASYPKSFIDLGVSFMPRVHTATLVALAGMLALIVGYANDRLYYYKLLLGSVRTGQELERKYDLPAKLTQDLSTAVSKRRASVVIFLFYVVALVVGLFLVFIFNSSYTVPLNRGG